MDQINPYRFGKWSDLTRKIRIKRSEEERGGAHRESVDGEVLAVLESNGEAVLAILELREGDDGV
jgi:hypothetical protein